MTVYSWLIFALWLIFIGYWAVSASSAKKNVSGPRWGRQAGVRLAIIALILIASRVPAVNHALHHVRAYVLTRNVALGVAGVILSALGIGIAIAARVYLGTNWGMPMSRKERPELVTTGPYTLVRHPIYSGLMLAMLGSAMAETIFWLVPLAIVSVYFLFSARTEERLMVEQFPANYPAYRKRTKMLIPFVL